MSYFFRRVHEKKSSCNRRGLRESVGTNVDETWSALLACKSGAGPITHFDASQHKTRFAAEVKGFDPVGLFGAREARKMDRFVQFAMAAAGEAMKGANLTINESNRDRVGDTDRYRYRRYQHDARCI